MSIEDYTFRPTTDDWYPNFPGDLVGIKIIPLLKSDFFRVAVWGADDFGMEKDPLTHDEARQLVLSLPVIITQQDLIERGFVWA